MPRPPTKTGGLEQAYNRHAGLEKLLVDEMQVEAIETYNARRDAALQDVRTIVGFALILLAVGAVIAAVTSGGWRRQQLAMP